MKYQIYDITEAVKRAKNNPQDKLFQVVTAVRDQVKAKGGTPSDEDELRLRDLVIAEGDHLIDCDFPEQLDTTLSSWLRLQTETKHLLMLKDNRFFKVATFKTCDCPKCTHARQVGIPTGKSYDA